MATGQLFVLLWVCLVVKGCNYAIGSYIVSFLDVLHRYPFTYFQHPQVSWQRCVLNVQTIWYQFFYHIPRKTQKTNTVSLRILVKHAVRFIAKKGCCLIVMIGGTAIKCFWRNDHDGYRHDEIKWWRYALNYSQRVVYANISQRTKYSKNLNEYCLWP